MYCIYYILFVVFLQYTGTSSSGGDSSCDERKKHRRRYNKPVTPLLRTDTCQSDNHVESEFNSTSAAEESCDTVIYLGPGRCYVSDRDLTDFENPPQQPQTNQKVAAVSDISNNKTPHYPHPAPVVNMKKPNHMTAGCRKSNEKKSLIAGNDIKLAGNSSPTQKCATNTNSIRELEPIVVNINSESLKLKSPLEEHSPVHNTELKQTADQHCFGTKTKDDFWVGHRKLELPEDFSQNYSDSLPVRGKNRCYSINTNEINNNNKFSTKKQRRNTDADYNKGERQTRSTNSSPCKRGRSMTYDVSNSNNIRALSLDRTLPKREHYEEQDNEENYRSNETISSLGTVENFERQLVSQIAERFAVEAEFSLSKEHDINNNNNITINNDSEDFYIDDDIDTISAGLDTRNPIDSYTNSRDTYYQNCRYSCGEIEPEVANINNDVISCNTCIGECVCYHDSPFYDIQQLRDFDSAEDTDERTDKELR